MTRVAAPEPIDNLGASAVNDALPADIPPELPDALVPYLQALTASPLAEVVRTASWVYPSLETLHVIGLGLLFGGIFVLDLRLLGANKGLSVQQLSRHILPWVWLGFALNLASGVMLFASDALALAANISFQLKMALLVVAGSNAALFHLAIYPGVARWDGDAPPLIVKLAAVASISIWLAIIALGRLIAYWD